MQQIIKREGNLVPYDRDRISAAIFRAQASVAEADRKTAEALAAEVENALVESYGEDATPSVEEIQDIVESVLIRTGRVETARAYIIYRNERARARASRAYEFEITDNIPYKKIYEILCWNMDHACLSISQINAVIEGGRFPELIRDADARYEAETAECAERILEHGGDLRIVIIAGPSASGKTTTAAKLGERLARAGRECSTINLDNYFFDLEHHPRDEFGDYDYESPESLDIDLINEHLGGLLAGETVKTPRYDFKTGKRTLNVHDTRVEKNRILLLDSLHGLCERMTAGIPASAKFKVYIETLGQLRSEDGQFMRWADNRLMRRMVRDGRVRNSRPETTLTHWHYVRRSELRNIIPFIKTADFIVNTALPYEMPLLKNEVFGLFPAALNEYRDNPNRQDAYIRAKRIYEFLLPLKQVAKTDCVPPGSLLREFIGGGRYE